MTASPERDGAGRGGGPGGRERDAGGLVRRLARRARSLSEALLAAVVLGAVAATVTGFLGRLWWALDLTAHFRVQYVAALAVAGAGLLALGRGRGTRGWAAVAGVFLVVNLGTVAPLYVGGGDASDEPAGRRLALRVVHLNLDMEHPEPERVAAYLAETRPDLVLLQELTPRWDSALARTLEAYPHRVTALRESPFGIGLFSRTPLVDGRVETPGEGMRTVVARIPLDGAELTVVGTHPFPPIRAGGTALRDRQIEAVAELAGSVDGPVLLLGDLNTTPWSWIWDRLVERGGFGDWDRGAGVAATWPADFPPLLRLPLDHALPSPGLRVVRKEVGPDVGSDHRPLEVEVALPR